MADGAMDGAMDGANIARAGLTAALNITDLVEDGLAQAADAPLLEQVTAEFRMRLTPEMRAQAAASAGVADQFVPSAQELIIRPEEIADPIGDDTFSPVPGLTHRYPDRVILHITKTCEVYCRFCFRRETVGETGHLPEDQLTAALAYIARTPAIWEVILTGGDPLVLSARRIAALVARLKAIAHVGVIRIHSRIPVVAPERITPELVTALKQHPSVWLVVHTNHADELTPAADRALALLADSGIALLSQSVLLRGINDRVEVLEALFRALVRRRVKPYYLHHCDLARGAGHFRTTIAEGQALMAALRGRISGTCLPTYVLDIPGGHGKVPLGPDWLEPADGLADQPGSWQVRDPKGGLHHYQDPSR